MAATKSVPSAGVEVPAVRPGRHGRDRPAPTPRRCPRHPRAARRPACPAPRARAPPRPRPTRPGTKSAGTARDRAALVDLDREQSRSLRRAPAATARPPGPRRPGPARPRTRRSRPAACGRARSCARAPASRRARARRRRQGRSAARHGGRGSGRRMVGSCSRARSCAGSAAWRAAPSGCRPGTRAHVGHDHAPRQAPAAKGRGDPGARLDVPVAPGRAQAEQRGRVAGRRQRRRSSRYPGGASVIGASPSATSPNAPNVSRPVPMMSKSSPYSVVLQ